LRFQARPSRSSRRVERQAAVSTCWASTPECGRGCASARARRRLASPLTPARSTRAGLVPTERRVALHIGREQGGEHRGRACDGGWKAHKVGVLRSVRAHTASPVELPAPVAITASKFIRERQGANQVAPRLCVLCAARWRRSSLFAAACLAISSRARALVCNGTRARCASMVKGLATRGRSGLCAAVGGLLHLAACKGAQGAACAGRRACSARAAKGRACYLVVHTCHVWYV
jgi:hypothetical protein